MKGNPLSRHVLQFSVFALLAILISDCHKDDPPGEGGGEETHAAPIKWKTTEKADLEVETDLLGTTQPLPNRIAHISAVVVGNVLSLLPDNDGKAVVEGQRLEKGQILVRLDDRVVRASRAKLMAGEAELKELIEQAAHSVELAQLDIDRLSRLQGNGNSRSSLPLVSRIELDKARLALKDAESKLKVAQAKEEIAHAERKAIDEELELYTLRTRSPGNSASSTSFIRTAVDNVRDAILIGGLFSILILLAFLRSWRATLISALAIPTTLAITFFFSLPCCWCTSCWFSSSAPWCCRCSSS